MSENGYIQGAGDDSEGWSHGLTPAVFWKQRKELVEASDEGLLDSIRHCMMLDQREAATEGAAARFGATNIYVGSLTSYGQRGSYDALIFCKADAKPVSSMGLTPPSRETPPRTLYLQCGEGKLGSRALRILLQRIIPFLSSLPTSSPRILCACPTGKDLAIGVALAVLCLFYDDDCESTKILQCP